MAVAATEKKSLLDSLEEIDLYLVPGSGLMHFDVETEQRATELAANLMAKAGYPPTTASTFFQSLQTSHKQQGDTYLTRHPSLSFNDPKIAGDFRGKPFQLVSERKFKKLRKQANAVRAENRHLEAWVNWQPPDQDPVAPANTREIFLTNRYSFSYPSTWRQSYSNDSDKVQIAPKGGAIRSASGESTVTIGVIVGMTGLEKQPLPDKDTLLEIIKASRPGLRATGKPETMTIDSRPLELVTLNGPSPIPGEKETVWVVSTNLTDRVFYLLLIAPEDKFFRMEPEFNAILASIRFYGHPDFGHMDERSQEGTVIRPQLID